jgi:hypothetical protein
LYLSLNIGGGGKGKKVRRVSYDSIYVAHTPKASNSLMERLLGTSKTTSSALSCVHSLVLAVLPYVYR